MNQLPALLKRPPLLQNTISASMKLFSVSRCRVGYHFFLLLLLMHFNLAPCREKNGTQNIASLEFPTRVYVLTVQKHRPLRRDSLPTSS